MPYDGEFAGYRSLTRIATSEKVTDIVSRCRTRTDGGSQAEVAPLSPVRPSGWIPDLVLAVDGSYHQLPVDNGYPSAELAYVTVSAVVLDIKKQRELDENRPVDPLASRDTEDATSMDWALPGCNVVLRDELSPSSSLRRLLYEALRDSRPANDGETLLETYESLLRRKPHGRPQRCPYLDCPTEADFIPGAGVRQCSCDRDLAWYSTDALRIHEGLNPHGPSGAMFAEAMQVWERVWVINFLRWIEAHPVLFRILSKLGIVLDGPLAVFGHPAWLSQAISSELRRLNARVREVIGQDILLVGVEKTGAFVDHFEALDAPTGADGETRFASQSAMLLTNEYIRSHIALGEKPFGEDTYFGRKLFYKTASGARIVASLPFLTVESADLSTASPDQFPRLEDALSLLDATFSARFPNALAPLVSAHAEASIPMNLGREVLERLARSLMTAEGA